MQVNSLARACDTKVLTSGRLGMCFVDCSFKEMTNLTFSQTGLIFAPIVSFIARLLLCPKVNIKLGQNSYQTVLSTIYAFDVA